DDPDVAELHGMTVFLQPDRAGAGLLVGLAGPGRAFDLDVVVNLLAVPDHGDTRVLGLLLARLVEPRRAERDVVGLPLHGLAGFVRVRRPAIIDRAAAVLRRGLAEGFEDLNL